MSPGTEKAFDFAQEATKQLITLATGVIALTVTFLTDVLKESTGGAVVFLRIGWVLYLLSIVCGIFTLLTLAGNLERSKDDAGPSIYGKGIVLFATSQVIFFCVALAFTLVFGFMAF